MRRSNKRENQHPILAVVGWFGISAILLSYGLNSFDIIQSHDPTYAVLNLLGAIALFLEAYLHHDAPLVVLNIIWAIIAVFGLVKFLF